MASQPTHRPAVRPVDPISAAMLICGMIFVHSAAAQTVRQSMCVTNGQVYATTIANNTLYVGGNFTQAGSATGCAVGIDATTGAPIKPYPLVGNPQLIGGVGKVGAVAPDGSGGWYLGGVFPAVSGQARNNLAHIDASGSLTSWTPDVNGEVKAVAAGGGVVYVGGAFTAIDGQTRNYIAAFDAATGALTSWNPSADNTVNALVVGSGVVYAGGTFSNIGLGSHSRLAALDVGTGNATGWAPSQFNVVSVNALALSGSNLYVGAATSGSGYVSEYPTAGTGFIVPTWTAQPPPTSPVNALALGGAVLYAGGDAGLFIELNAANGALIAWSPGANNTVRALAYSGTVVYAGGDFTAMGGQTRAWLAAVNSVTAAPTDWDPSAAGLYGSNGVYAMAMNGNTIFVGGNFGIMNAQPRNNLAAFDLTSGVVTAWNPNSGGEIRTIVTANNTVYVGGTFQSMGMQTRHNVAAVDMLSGTLMGWNPDVWNPSFPSAAYALVTNGSTIWIGGNFTTVNGLSHVNVASVDASSGVVNSWPVSTNNTVNTLAMKTEPTFPFTVTIFAGGLFTQTNGVAKSRIASWDGGTGALNSFESNANGTVNTLAYTSCGLNCGTLWVGGSFSSIGGVTRNRAATLDASTAAAKAWDPNVTGSVYVLSVGTPVYLGGNFTSVHGQARKDIAAVDAATGEATSWNPTAQREVYALAHNGSTVYAGGFFNTIYGLPFIYLAGVFDGSVTSVDADPVVAHPSMLRASPNPFVTQTALQFALSNAEDASISVYDVRGRLVRALHRGILTAGDRSMTWDGRNDSGRPVGSGTYFIHVETPTQTLSSKVYRLR